MKKVPANYHLLKRKRGGGWYFRRRVPAHLRKVIGRLFVQFSLNTTDLRTAVKRREIEDIKWSATFDEAERRIARPQAASDQASPANKKALTEPVAIRLVREYVERMDTRRANGWSTDTPLSGEDRIEAERDVEIELSIARGMGHPEDHDQMISIAWDKIFSSAEFKVDQEACASAAIYDLVKRACIELEKRALARLRDDRRHNFFDVLFDPAAPPAVTVKELSEQLLAMKREEGVARKLSPKTIDTQNESLALVREILGDHTLVRDIGFDECQRFRSTLAHVPPNRTKVYKGLTLSDAIARAKEEGRSGLMPNTQQGYLASLCDLLELAVNKDLIKKNYAEKMRPLAAEDLAPEAKRAPFDLEQIRAFFHSSYYRSCADAGGVPYRHADKAWRYWFPLLSIFTGMRPKEIFQLHVDDFRQTPKGTWYLDVTATNDDEQAPQFKKTTKTLNSRRQIPLHPELERLGFVSFVGEQRAASNDPRLFRDIARNGYDDPAHYPLKYFRETYLKEAIDLKPRQSPYSFRHSWRDATRRIEASQDFLTAIGAWSGGKTTATRYGSPHQPDLYAKDVARISYEGLNLSHLYPKSPSQ